MYAIFLYNYSVILVVLQPNTNFLYVKKKNCFQKPKFQGGRKVSKRLQHALEKRANKMLLKASQTLEHSTGLTLGNRRPAMLLG